VCLQKQFGLAQNPRSTASVEAAAGGFENSVLEDHIQACPFSVPASAQLLQSDYGNRGLRSRARVGVSGFVRSFDTILTVRRFRKYCGAGFVESEGAVAKREAAASEKMQVAIMFDVRLLRRGKNLIIALVTSSILQSALAQSHSKPLPEFEDYPVKEVFSGTPHPPILVTR
jgi:hypothetical protein